MQAIIVRDRDKGLAGLSLAEMPYPIAGENDVIVRVHGAGFISTELEWTGTWADRAGQRPEAKHPGPRSVRCRR